MPAPIQNPRLTQPGVIAGGVQTPEGFRLDENVSPVVQLRDVQHSPDKRDGFAWHARQAVAAFVGVRSFVGISGVQVGIDYKIEVNQFWAMANLQAEDVILSMVDATFFAGMTQRTAHRVIATDLPGVPGGGDFQRLPVVCNGRTDAALPSTDFWIQTFNATEYASTAGLNNGVRYTLDPPVVLWPGRFGLNGLAAVGVFAGNANVQVEAGFSGRLWLPGSGVEASSNP
jgi:hypothetical protein